MTLLRTGLMSVLAAALVATAMPAQSPPPAASDSVHVALDSIGSMDELLGASVGYVGITPGVVRAFRLLTRQRNAPALFQKMLEQPRRAAQLYGLAGLYLVDRNAMNSAAPSLLEAHDTVEVVFGDVESPLPVARVARAIVNGKLPRSLMGGPYYDPR